MATTEATPPAPVPGPPHSGFLERRRFHIAARGSTVRTELVAGVVTFLTMASILFVNPAVLGGVADPSRRELPFDQLLTVTALVAGVMTILMGLVASSASGVSEGGRTGLAAVMVGALFLLARFFSPLAGVIPPEATAPVLVVVGDFMLRATADMDWSDPASASPRSSRWP